MNVSPFSCNCSSQGFWGPIGPFSSKHNIFLLRIIEISYSPKMSPAPLIQGLCIPLFILYFERPVKYQTTQKAPKL